MSLRDESATWVDYAAITTISEVIAINSLASFTFLTEAKRLVGDEFVGTEAVVQLHHVYLVRCHPRHLVGFICCSLGHGATNHIDTRAPESVGRVRSQANATDLDRLVLKAMSANKVLRA